MISYMIRRLVLAVPTVLAVTLVIFIIMHLVPGDIVDLITGTQNYLSEEQLQEIYKNLGLDKPLIIQYAIWLKNVFTFDLGISLRTGESISKMIFDKFKVTIELAIFSIVIASLIGIPLGMISGIHRNTKIDRIVRLISLLGISTPAFWVGAILIVLFSRIFENYRIFGYVSFFTSPLENLSVMFLPSFTLGFLISTQLMKITRAGVIETYHQEYVKVARSKGLPERKVIWKHVFRNALIPVITTAGIQFGYLMGGTVIIENLFALPGIGRLLFEAVSKRDYPAILGIVLFIAVFIVIINLIVDVLYTLIDPRVRLD